MYLAYSHNALRAYRVSGPAVFDVPGFSYLRVRAQPAGFHPTQRCNPVVPAVGT
jgi:hypothetical protein